VRRAYRFLKTVALKYLPERTLRRLKIWHYRRVLRLSTDADEQDLKVVRRLAQRGTTATDLGANIGIYTKVLSDVVGPDGTVISVEPVPETFEVLSANVRTFQMSNVLCVNAAISEGGRDVVMELPNYESGGTNFYQARIRDAENPTVWPKRELRVKGTTLDHLLAEAPNVSFIKCDIEGQELTCLSGADMVFKQHAPAWLMEVWGDPDDATDSARQVFQAFEDWSYSAWWFNGRKLNLRRPGERSTNYFFLKPDHIARLRKTSPELFD
jgi:FkbM family methyltransferase